MLGDDRDRVFRAYQYLDKHYEAPAAEAVPAVMTEEQA